MKKLAPWLHSLKYFLIALVIIVVGAAVLTVTSFTPQFPYSEASSSTAEIIEFTGTPWPENAQLLNSSVESALDTQILFKTELPSAEVLPWLEGLKGSELTEKLVPVQEDDWALKNKQHSWWDVSVSPNTKRIYFSNYTLNRHYTIFVVEDGENSELYVSVHSN